MASSKIAQTAIVAAGRAILDAIAEMGADGIPSGHLYAALMTTGCDIQTYDAIIASLERMGAVRQRSNVLYARPY